MVEQVSDWGPDDWKAFIKEQAAQWADMSKENSLFELREEMDRLENEGKMDSDEYRALRAQWEELTKPQPARW